MAGNRRKLKAFETHASFPERDASRDRSVLAAIRGSLARRSERISEVADLDDEAVVLAEMDFPEHDAERDAEILDAIRSALAFRRTFERGAVQAARATRMPHRCDERDAAMSTELRAALAFRRAFVDGEAARDFPSETTRRRVARGSARGRHGAQSTRTHRRRPRPRRSGRGQSSWIALAAGIAAAAIVLGAYFRPAPAGDTPVVRTPDEDVRPEDPERPDDPRDRTPRHPDRQHPDRPQTGGDTGGSDVRPSPPRMATADERLAAARQSASRLALLLSAAEHDEVPGAPPGFTARVARALLRLDPIHARANQALGRVLYQGRWMRPEERELRIRQEEARGGDGTPSPPLSEQFGQMLADAGKDVDALWKVHQWAKRQKLEAQARIAAERLLEVDRTHAGAHEALDHAYVAETGEWLTRAELEARKGATVAPTIRPPAWVEVLGEQPLLASSGRVDVWAQRPRGDVAGAQRDLAALANRMGSYADGFVTRRKRDLRRLGYESAKVVDRHRLTVAVFTDPRAYAAFADAQGETLARDQAGFVPMSMAVAMVRPVGELAAAEDPFYDEFLLETYRPRTHADGHRRVLWRSGVDAQRRFGARVVVDSTEHFVVVARDTKKNRKTVPQVVTRVAELEQQMRDGGMLIDKPLKRTCSVILCDGGEQYRKAVSGGTARQVPSWGGTYEPAAAQWICQTRYQDDVLHGAALMILHQVTTRLPKGGDLFFYHEGLAHLAAGQVLSAKRGVHGRWAPRVKRALARKALRPLAEVLADDRGQVLASAGYARDAARYHAESWAFVHYLWYARGGTYRARLLALLRTCNYQTINRERFMKLMMIRDVPALERAYQRHIEKMKLR